MQEDTRTGFPCGHSAHTRCVFQTIIHNGFGIQCGDCNTRLIEAGDIHRMLRIRNGEADMMQQVERMYASNAEFHKDAVGYKRSFNQYKKHHVLAKREIRDVVKQYRDEIHNYIQCIKYLKKSYLKDILKMPKVKDAIRCRNRVSKKLLGLSNKWGIPGRYLDELVAVRNPYLNIRSDIRQCMRTGAYKVWNL
jgi:hypothetical protein